MTRLRLVSVTVLAEFVADDGETLTPVTVEPVKVPAADWPTYATTTFAEAQAALEAQL